VRRIKRTFVGAFHGGARERRLSSLFPTLPLGFPIAKRNGQPEAESEARRTFRPSASSNKAMHARCGIARLYSTCGQALLVHTHVVLGYPMVSANLIPWRAPVRKWPRQKCGAIEWEETLWRPFPRVGLSCGAAVVAAASFLDLQHLEARARAEDRSPERVNGAGLRVCRTDDARVSAALRRKGPLFTYFESEYRRSSRRLLRAKFAD